MSSTELERLNRKWRKLKGEDIPSEIASQEIAIIRRAVDALQRGDHVFVPPAVIEENKDGIGHGDSMREWDSDGFY